MGHRAMIFDLDDTLVDLERDGHRVAYNAAFGAAGLPLRWSVREYGRLLRVPDGRDRVGAFLRENGHDTRIAGALHADHTARLRHLVAEGAISPRPGTRELLLDLTTDGVRLAVASAGPREWVVPLVAGMFGATTFSAVVTGSDVLAPRRHVAVHLAALRALGMDPADVLAVHGSAGGMRAAHAAGLTCAVVPTDYTRDQDFTGAVSVCRDFRRLRRGVLIPAGR